MIITQREARVLDCSREGRALLSLTVNLQIEVASINALKSRQRDVNVLVDQLPEDWTASLFNADDAHRQAGHLELFADGVNVRIELILDVRAEDHDEFSV